MTPCHAPFPRPRTARAGFSLVELMITLVLLAVVVSVIATVLIGSQRSKADTEARLEAQQSGRAISDIIAQDIRTAGYGADNNTTPNQPPFAYVDSVEIMINANQVPFPDTTAGAPVEPKALNPSLTPRPFKLTGAYLPVNYTTGAETIVYTLDLNNDGVIDAADQAQPIAIEAQRTANPNDYVLARVVYGANGTGTTNGGSLQKVGLVRGPATGIPPLYTVYLNGNATPWDWHQGAIPANRLKDITSIKLAVTTEGRRPGPDHTYPRATLTTEINSIRNTPNVVTAQMYHVTGFVYNDLNHNTSQDAGEPGLPGVIVRLGAVSVAQTSSTGYFDVCGVQNQYVLYQTPPTGFGAFSPDSFAVDFVANPADMVHSFADTALTGGWLDDTCYVDVNANSVFDAGDMRVNSATISCAGQSCKSGADGGAAIFLPPGSQNIAITPPDSFIVVSPNPTPVTITNGGTTVIYTKLAPGGTGKVTGYVFLDPNKSGTKDAGEPGLPGAWVGVTSNGGSTVLGYATTDANGYYEVIVPNNMPAATTPYAVTVVPPDGYYPTGATAISPIWVAQGQTLTGNNFGVVNFTSFQLLADRVLALGTANLLEKDWTGSDSQWGSKASFDEDLILCSEYVSAPNISVWFNQTDNAAKPQAFDSTWTYQRNALSSALCIATGPIDTSSTGGNVPAREDCVTGLQAKASGNIAVWLTKNTSGNLGYLADAPNLYQTSDAGDVQQVLLQDCAGGTALDIIVGTKSPAPFTGTVEVWRGDGAGHFVQDEVYPNAGNLPGNSMGEVRALVLRDVTNDGNKDLIVGTRTGDGTGHIHVMEFESRTPGNRFRDIEDYDVVGEVTSMVSLDVDGDGTPDLVVGTRLTANTGNVQYWRGLGSGQFALAATFVAPGPVLTLTAADMGGSTRKDIIFGYRNSDTSFNGGVRILFTDLGTLPPSAVDPAGGTSSYMTTSIAAWNFNYIVNPSTTPGPYYMDLAIAQKPTATTGRLLVFIR